VPLTKKERKVKRAMEKEYGKEKGERVFYASERKGKLKGVAKHRSGKRKHGLLHNLCFGKCD
jgi:hypothetical protein